MMIVALNVATAGWTRPPRGPVHPLAPAVRTPWQVQLCAAEFSTTESSSPPLPPPPSSPPKAPSTAAATAAAALASMEFDGWDARSNWALEDAVPKFSLDGGKIVLWRRMSLEVPELLTFSAAELRAKWLATAGPDVAARLQDEPPYLEDWVCVGPGRYEGAIFNLPSMRDGALRGTVEHFDGELELASAAGTAASAGGADGECAFEALDGTRRWVRTRDGALFQLGLPRADGALTAAGSLPLLSSEGREAVTEGAGAVVGAARGAASALGPVLLTGGGLAIASAMAYMVLGHHHVDVSVFIV